MKHIFIILFSLLFTSMAYTQWIRQTTGITNPIRDVEFINRFTGWGCADTKIIKTTNGGDTWFQQISNLNNIIMQLYPIDSQLVYAVGLNSTIVKTTNGGENWILIRSLPSPQGDSYEGVYFLNKDTGWICGQSQILKTTDGCQTFDSVYVPGWCTDIYFKDGLNGVCSGETAVFFRTSDGGETWQQVQVIGTTPQYNFLRLATIGDTCWLPGSAGPVYRSTNFGVTWDSLAEVQNGFNSSYSIEFANSKTGWIGGEGSFLQKTTDGGYTWQAEEVSLLGPGFIRNIFAYNDSIVWASGGAGKMLHTTTGGQVFIKYLSNEIPEQHELLQNYPNPFNNQTIIKFNIKSKGIVSIIITDVMGKTVYETDKKDLNPGSYQFLYNPVLSGGIYFYRLLFNNTIIETKKMVLLK